MITRSFIYIALTSVAVVGCSIALYVKSRLLLEEQTDRDMKAYLKLIGNTALVELPQLSRFTGCRMYAKVSSRVTIICIIPLIFISNYPVTVNIYICGSICRFFALSPPFNCYLNIDLMIITDGVYESWRNGQGQSGKTHATRGHA